MPGPVPDECIVDDDPDAVVEQGLVAIPPSAIEVFLEEESGGPLRCRPSGDPCPALADCVGAPVQVPVGTEATLAVGLRVREPLSVEIQSVTFGPGSDPAFTLLEPLPSAVQAPDEAFVFVAVTPSTEDTIVAEVIIASDARNTETEPLRITVQVEGVQP